MQKRRGHNEGTIFQKDGKWYGLVNLGYRVDPKTGARRRHRKKLTADTRGELQKKLNAALHSQDQGVRLTIDGKRFGAFMQEWIGRSTLKPSTVENYRFLIEKHIAPALGTLPLLKIETAHLEQFARDKLDSGLSIRTVRYLIAIISSALSDLVPRQRPYNPAREVRMPDAASVAVEATPGAKLPNEERRFLEVAEAKTLLACLTGHRLEALFVVYLGLGLRRGEALGLDWKDVDLEKGEVTISRSLQRLKKKGQAGKLVFQTPKTATSDRIVSLPAFVLSSFLNHKERQALERGDAGEAWREHGLVFTTAIGTPIEPRNVLRTFHQLLGTVKIPKHRLHDLRHTAAAMMLSQGVELNAVKAILGHASIAITDHFYGKLPQSALRAAAEKVNGLFSSPSGLATAAPPKRLN